MGALSIVFFIAVVLGVIKLNELVSSRKQLRENYNQSDTPQQPQQLLYVQPPVPPQFLTPLSAGVIGGVASFFLLTGTQKDAGWLILGPGLIFVAGLFSASLTVLAYALHAYKNRVSCYYRRYVYISAIYVFLCLVLIVMAIYGTAYEQKEIVGGFLLWMVFMSFVALPSIGAYIVFSFLRRSIVRRFSKKR